MAKLIELEVEAPKNLKAGEKFTVEVAIPTAPRAPRGMLAGIALEDMTLDQLKRELINAKSVLYKAKLRGAPEQTIKANEERVAAAEAMRAKRLAEAQEVQVEEEEEEEVEV